MNSKESANGRPDQGLTEESILITSTGTHESSGIVAGQHDSRARDGDEQHGSTDEGNGVGTGDEYRQPIFDGIDYPVKVDEIIERFRQHPSIRMRPISTQNLYTRMFRRFAKAGRLENYTRKQLAGPKGKRLILEHIADNIPLKSRRTVLAGLKKVWMFALDLPWPVDTDRDIGKLPKVQRRTTPPDAKVNVWNEALEHEPSPYPRCLWRIIAQSGLRPSTVAKLRWRHVRHDEHGQPCEIRANGAEAGFKTFADVAWWLPPDVSVALVELRKWLEDPSEDDPILPWMDGWGHIEKARETHTAQISAHWYQLKKKYGLPQLMPVDLRHWVASQCRDGVKLHEQARSYMMGHEQPIMNMGDHYDNRDVETNLARQAEKFPYGPLGIFTQPNRVEITNDLPSDIVSVLTAYRDGQEGFMAVMAKLEQWRLSAKQEAPKAVQ